MNIVIGLNVGGQIYKTTRDTLTRFPESLLGSKFYEKVPKEKDTGGNYVLDRDGPLFRYVLNFLRNKELALPDDFHDFGQLTLEAKYYQIPGLLEAVKQAERENTCERHTVYVTAECVTDNETENKKWMVRSHNLDVLWKLTLNVQPDSDLLKKFKEKAGTYCVEMQDVTRQILFKNIWSFGFTLLTVSSGEQDKECYEFVRNHYNNREDSN